VLTVLKAWGEAEEVTVGVFEVGRKDEVDVDEDDIVPLLLSLRDERPAVDVDDDPEELLVEVTKLERVVLKLISVVQIATPSELVVVVIVLSAVIPNSL
jgi:hypothetical protein